MTGLPIDFKYNSYDTIKKNHVIYMPAIFLQLFLRYSQSINIFYKIM